MLEPWRVRHSRITYEDPWLKVRSDSCVTRTGRVIEPFHVLEYATWVCVVALTAEGEIVLVREYRHGAGRIITGLPGGVVDVSEPHPASAALRELTEETGYAAGSLGALGEHYANPANQTNLTCSFLALDCRLVGQPSLDPNEEIEVVREDFPRFLRRFWAGEVVPQASHANAIHDACHAILGGRPPVPAELREAVFRELRLHHGLEGLAR
jgi:8-oxo-dGTP pyrophosphatase MutT (NUDIX family)